MKITRYDTAQSYEAPEHFGISCLRLQGKDASETDTVWLGLSHILPGGHTSLKAADVEKIYLVIDGQVTVQTDNGENILDRLDSCRLAPGEARALHNRTNKPASILLVMPN